MSAFHGLVIFESLPTEQELNTFWQQWIFKPEEESNYSRKKNVLPFITGRFQDYNFSKVSQISSQDLVHIGFVITSQNEFSYYYDYEGSNMSEYHQRELFIKPSFAEILQHTFLNHQHSFFLNAECRF